jgi:hypothetical protein
MSSLLEQAIIDAKTLKETARKNAEAAILEKYSNEIKQSIETLLEQDEPTAEATTPDITTDVGTSEETKKVVEKIPPAYLGENNSEEIELDLDSLVEKVNEMKKTLSIEEIPAEETADEPTPQIPTRIAQDTIAETEMPETSEESTQQLQEEESFEVDEQLAEELTIDLENVIPGGVQGNHIELEKQMSIAKALEAQLEDLKEHLKLKDTQIEHIEAELSEAKDMLNAKASELKESKEKLKKSMSINLHLKESFEQFSKKLNEVNLMNARLLYSNKVLRNASLNERQRDQIAEAISNASTVEEAKTVYETLQKSMQTVVEKRTAPQSLSEALSKAPSPFLPRKSNTVDPAQDRWKLLAGIKK